MTSAAFFSILDKLKAGWDIVCPYVEFCLLLLIIYSLLYLFRRTRAISVLWGVIVILLGLGFLAESLNMEVFQWLLRNLWMTLTTVLIVIFQPELRRAFAELGSLFSPYWRNRQREQKEMIEEIAAAVVQMSFSRCGALIVFERRIGLAAITGNAVQLDAKVNSLLLQSLFYPNSPLHDGAVIIQNGRVVAAHAILPLTQENNYRSLGTRHRAALGITEETDAVVVVVSEETGRISYALKGKLTENVSEDKLVDFLRRKLLDQKEPEPPMKQEKQHEVL